MDRPPGVPGLVGADAPGLAGRRPAPAARRHRAGPRARIQRPGLAQLGALRAAAGGGPPRFLGPTTEAERGARNPPPLLTAVSTPRRCGVRVTSTCRGPRIGPVARASGRSGRRGRMRTGPLAVRVMSTGRPASASEGQAVHRTLARRAGTTGATRPVNSTAGQQCADRLDPARPARVGHPGEGHQGQATARHGGDPAHRVDPSPQPAAPPGGGPPAAPTARRECPPRHHAATIMASSPTDAPARTTPGPKTARITTTPHTPATSPVPAALTARATPWATVVGRAGWRLLTSVGRVCRRSPGPPGRDPRRCRPRPPAGGTGRPPPPPGRPGA